MLETLQQLEYTTDAQLLYSFHPETVNTAIANINQDLSSLTAAANAHNLQLNHSKSQCMFGRAKALSNYI